MLHAIQKRMTGTHQAASAGIVEARVLRDQDAHLAQPALDREKAEFYARLTETRRQLARLERELSIYRKDDV